MTPEEKAKRYDEAFEIARNVWRFSSNNAEIMRMEEIFPELRDSENKNIKEEIKIILANTDFSQFALDYTFADMVTWLEKQCDHANFRNKIQIGDKVTRNEAGILVNMSQLNRIAKPAKDKKKHKFTIGDIISNDNVTYRVDNIIKNCIGQDCYFLVNIKSEKNGTRYLPLINSEGKIHNSGEITWLCEQVDAKFEKQNEQKFIDKPKFKVGDWIVNDYCFGKVIEITNDAYLLDTGQGIPFSCEHNVHLWTIKDAKDGDVLVDKYNNIGIYQGDKNAVTWDSYCYCGVNKGFYDKGSHEFPCYPATKEQRDTLMKAMDDAGYTFNFEKKELKKIEQKSQRIVSAEAKEALYDKPAWSEEDEAGLSDALWAIKQAKTIAKDENDMGNLWYAENWLNSIKNRIQPKQKWSEEDERILDALVTSLNNEYFARRLETLKGIEILPVINWLKSIKQRIKE